MNRKEIQAALKARGISQAELARQAGVYPATISQFLRRKFKSKRLAALLDKSLGIEGAIR